MAEKLGTIRQDPDLDSLLFTLISRATGDCQELAAQLCPRSGGHAKEEGWLQATAFKARVPPVVTD